MEVPVDYFAWTQRLGCSQAVCNSSVKKILCKGITEFLWDNLSNAIFPAGKATEIRKNILLYKLKNMINDPVIQATKDLAQLRVESNKMDLRISKLNKEYEEQDFLVREKVQELRKIKAERSIAEAKKHLLRLKHNQTITQLHDCSNMRLVCQHLMPKISKDVNQEKIDRSLNVVANLYSVANKKHVWKEVSDILGEIEVPTLWNYLYQNLSQNVNKLIELSSVKDPDNSNTIGETIDKGIARACGLHVLMVSKKILHNVKANVYEQNIVDYMEKIEGMIVESPDVSEWLALELETKKLEVARRALQNEVDKMKEDNDDNNVLISELVELTADIKDIDMEIETQARDIQQSLVLLKSATSLINKIKEKIRYILQKITLLQSESFDCKLLDNELNVELNIFYENLDLKALRKIMLKGDIGLYRHTKCCFADACVQISSQQCPRLMPYFPMIQIPIYTLVDCYKNIFANITYKKLQSLSQDTEEDLESNTSLVSTQENNNHDTLHLMNLSKTVYERAKEEINQFDSILNAWSNQTIREVMALVEKTVDDVSYPEWFQRYSLLLYVIQQPK